MLAQALQVAAFAVTVAVTIAVLAQASASASADDSSAAASLPPHELVRVVLIGATGNLASKYLWVAAFRLAQQAHVERNQQYQFIAAASNPRAAGLKWQDAFFDEAFLQRVCGREDDAAVSAASVATDRRRQELRVQCEAFFYDRFLPSIEYAPLRDEAQYEQLAASLATESTDAAHASRARVEVGRLVYLAIPPAFFARTSELAHKYLRPPRITARASRPAPFFRVLVEKPFGVDSSSAQRLELRLRQSLDPDEIYLVDHYAGKAAVQALREYFVLNRAALKPRWSARSIRSITVRMTEDETVAARIQYFHTAGIIRDVMVNHLHLLLSLAVSPASLHSDDDEMAEEAVSSLAFTHSLTLDSHAHALLLGQYDSYAAHYALATGHALRTNSTFVPTAARVQLASSASQWRGTAFVLEAAKAVHERRLELVVAFYEAGDHASGVPTAPGDHENVCELRVTLQTRVNVASERIAWSCRFLDGLDAPRDVPSAYDALLYEAARGTRSHFASVDDAIAAWTLWTPIIERAERAAINLRAASRSSNDSSDELIYSTGSASWCPAAAALVAPSSRSTLDTEPHVEL